ncbi:MAG TPA: methyltransferase domain-containing protein, partial [Cyclobacteriaceae bacterium]|nr:methyltransferase domain-containing protein [Cyclobacteriaceae bacterium]
MTSLQTRSAEIEIMDDLNCNGEVVDQTLRELEVINRLLGGDHVTINGIRKLIKEKRPYSIADCGCGGGDLAMKIFEWGKKNGYQFNVTGVDANPYIIDIARKNFGNINFEAVNVFSDQFKERKYDVITATLFVHHFTNEELVALFRSWRSQAKLGVVINDIHRHYLAYHSIRLLTKFFSRSAMVKFDAPLSVRRAFKRSDLIG